MIEIFKKSVYAMMAAALLAGGLEAPVSVRAQENGLQDGISPLEEKAGVTVINGEEFMAALEDKRSPITVTGKFVISNQADVDNRMLPIGIPANTVIQGSSGAEICSRSPIQLEGDGVVFRDVGLTFESSTALDSVPHREIFLAGHSLTLDNVNTYLPGRPDLGSFGGSEKELLPTVYAGGYTGTDVGGNASLTVINSNNETMFQGIYMGHDGGSDNKVPYRGAAAVNLDAKAIVRDTVDTGRNSQAEICISGTGNQSANAKKFSGNENTVLTLTGVFMESTASDTVNIENIGNIVLENEACLTPETETLYNISLKSGACLDFNSVGNVVINGNFSGEEDRAKDRGILVLNSEGSLSVRGTITGTTQFQTGHRLFPGTLISDKSYIFAEAGSGTELNFVLAQKKIDEGYELKHEAGVWTVYGEPVNSWEIGRIEILSAPSKVDLEKIPAGMDGVIPDEDVYFEIKWYDKNGEVFKDADILEYYMFNEADYVIRIRTDYWESDDADVLGKTDWYQFVSLMASEQYPGRYYLRAHEGAVPGDYTFLFCSDYFEGELTTVADVKKLKDTVMAERRVIFYGQDTEEPEHKHVYQSAVIKEAACTQAGIRTYACSCGDTYTEKIAALGHRPVTDPAIPPTETSNGKTEGSHCGVCGETIKAQETIPATGKPGTPGNSTDSGTSQPHKHTYRSAVTKESTCTQTGIRTYTCSCGDTYTEKIALADHRYVREMIPATPQSSGKQQQVCRICAHTKAAAVIDSPRELILEKTDYSYDGKAKKPAVTVKDSGGKILTAGTDYRVSYPKGRKTPGVYTVTVDFQGNYSGRMTGAFTVKPKKTSLKKLTAKSKGIQVKWKKQTAQIDGYQIQYGTSKNFTGKTVKLTTAKKSATTKNISKLKGKKQYYVRIRTYKTVKVNGKKQKLYSDWSAKKVVRTKK